MNLAAVAWEILALVCYRVVVEVVAVEMVALETDAWEMDLHESEADGIGGFWQFSTVAAAVSCVLWRYSTAQSRRVSNTSNSEDSWAYF